MITPCSSDTCATPRFGCASCGEASSCDEQRRPDSSSNTTLNFPPNILNPHRITAKPHPAQTMTKNAPSLRKAASNADLYSDPSPPASRPLRHAYSTLSRAHTTASLSHRPGRGLNDESRSRHSVAAPYANLIDVDEEYGGMVRQERQCPPPVPPKILEEGTAGKDKGKVTMEDVRKLYDMEKREMERKRAVQRLSDEGNEQLIRDSIAGRLPGRCGIQPSPSWGVFTQAVAARSKEGPERYTKPFTDFMTSTSLPTTDCLWHSLISRRQPHCFPCR